MSNSIAPNIEKRCSVITGDRLCTACGYNLTGQFVMREPHYQLLIVRCPECGTVAGVQEYPLLGRWANRWAMLIAGFWVMVVLGLAVGTGAAIFGFSVGIGEVSANKLAGQLWNQNQAAVTSTPTAQEIAEKIELLGGWRSAVDWNALWICLPFTLVVTILGCVWSVVTLAGGWRGKIVAMVLIMLVAIIFTAMVFMEWLDPNRMGPWIAARRTIGIPAMCVALTYGAFILSIGMMIGGPLTRWMLRILLPPRLCQSLAVLWTARGLKPPSVKAR